MWITHNRAPYDNGHPIGEGIQVCNNKMQNIERPFHNT